MPQIFRAINGCIGAAAAIARIGIASVRQSAVKEDGVAGLKLDGDLVSDVYIVVMENMSLDRMVMVRQVYRVACRNDMKAAVLDGRRIYGEPEVHGVRFEPGPEGRVLVQRGFDTMVSWLHEHGITEHLDSGLEK